MTAREILVGFVSLQRLLDRKGILKREIDTPPEEVLQLRAELEARRVTLTDKRLRSAQLAAEHSALSPELEALREEREHFRKQKSMVTNMKQLSAVVSELDHVEGEIRTREDRLLEVMQELDSLDGALAALEQETPEERTRREQAEVTWETRKKAAAIELKGVERSIREVSAQIGERAFERFRKLWNSRKPNAVVPLDGTSCSACHAELRPSLVQLVRTAEELQYCDSCRRLLYDPEQFPP